MTVYKYTLLLPGVAPQRAEMSGEGYHSLKQQISTLLSGGEVEHVSVLNEGKAADMFVDADFIDKGLARNDEATKIYRANSMRRSPGQDPEGLPIIAGVAVIFDDKIWS